MTASAARLVVAKCERVTSVRFHGAPSCYAYVRMWPAALAVCACLAARGAS